jgi:ubiquinol-cytochrome c reductase cytochrome b subunit
MIGGITVHLGILWVQKHTQYPGGRARETNVIGRHFWPGQVFRSMGLFFLTAAILAVLGGLAQINPVWVYGPYQPFAVSSPAQPDWYLGWLEGALRIGPNWEPTVFGVTLPSLLLPAIVLPTIVFGAFTLWPFIEKRLSGDRSEHELLQWPWQAPARLAIGVAALTLFVVLTLAGGNDVLAVFLHVGLEEFTNALRVLVVVGPIVAGVLAYRLAIERRRQDARSRTPMERLSEGAAGDADEVPGGAFGQGDR